MKPPLPSRSITVEGARHNNLKNVSVQIPVGAVTAITGVAGAGKSSLAFDILYAEGHRRYVETFSAYARQFLERLDRPKAERIEGVLPAVAIDRTAPVRSSRSTVGTMTSIADYLRALFARASQLTCARCGKPVVRATPSAIFERLVSEAPGQQALVTFALTSGKLSPTLLRESLARNGFQRVLENGEAVKLDAAALTADPVCVVLDRVRIDAHSRQRLIDSFEAALRWGHGSLTVQVEGKALTWSESLTCCGVTYPDPSAAMFSFNNPVGACESCRGFGRTMGIDPNLVVPDPRLSIKQGCLKPLQSPSYKECQDDLERFCRRAGIPLGTPWAELDDKTRAQIWDGEPDGRKDWKRKWYGVAGFFEWLEGRSYKMHVRVLLSRYRHYSAVHRLRRHAAQARGAALHGGGAYLACARGRDPHARRCVLFRVAAPPHGCRQHVAPR
ncbi:MAG: hypothetical protein KA712_24605 [Myxococcales bacterium]|nr:hypothetical protein [Myxococcales bacterium]